jgi:peptidoglycan/xylan/chitin deacetylase (PgdA/CDA1 family)
MQRRKRGADLLKRIKRLSLAALKASGAFETVARSSWRNNRLLVLGYHGVSLHDEHEWNPGIYLSPEVFAGRLDLLARLRCNVLPLDDALRRLRDGRLPPRSVALTFDDGHHDFAEVAFPMLQRFGYPVTVYLTTYYVEYNVPVFDLAVSYLLWRCARRGNVTVEFREDVLRLATRTPRQRAASFAILAGHARRHALSGADKDGIVAVLADAAGVDYAELKARRMLHLLDADAIRRLHSQSVDFQLHTHTHRVPTDEHHFKREVTRNAERVTAMTGTRPEHFCYPSGEWHRLCFSWLREIGIASAVSTDVGMAARTSNPWCLPRLLDHGAISGIEYETWLCGILRNRR